MLIRINRQGDGRAQVVEEVLYSSHIRFGGARAVDPERVDEARAILAKYAKSVGPLMYTMYIMRMTATVLCGAAFVAAALSQTLFWLIPAAITGVVAAGAAVFTYRYRMLSSAVTRLQEVSRGLSRMHEFLIPNDLNDSAAWEAAPLYDAVVRARAKTETLRSSQTEMSGYVALSEAQRDHLTEIVEQIHVSNADTKVAEQALANLLSPTSADAAKYQKAALK